MDEGINVSAAASGLPGPPPLAIALVSSFYTQEEHPLDRQRQHASTHTGTRPAVMRTPVQGPLLLSPLMEAKCIEPESPSMNLATLSDSTGSQTGSVTLPASIELSSIQPPAGVEPLAEKSDDTFDESNYVGLWHKPAKFGDSYDENKDYYEFENRMSYEYRPSLDCDRPSPSPAWMLGTTDSARSTMTNSSVMSSRGSFGGSFMSSVRRSIDVMRGMRASNPGGGVGPFKPDISQFDKHQGRYSYEKPRKMD